MTKSLDLHPREISVFAVLAQHLHFGEAAETLHMTQPHLSRLVMRLEQKLGFKLLTRSTRQVRLTEEGRMFLAESAALLEQLDRLSTLSKLSRGRGTNRISLASTPSGVAVLGPILKEYSFTISHAEIELQVAGTSQQVGLLLAGKIQMGFVRPVSGPDGLNAIMRDQLPLMAQTPTLAAGGISTLSIGYEKWIVALPDGHPLAAQPDVEIAQLADDRIVRFYGHSIDPGFQRQVEEMFSRAQTVLTPGPSAADTMSAACLVSAGLGVAILPHWIGILNLPGMIIRPLRNSHKPFPLICIWNRMDISPELQNFVGFLEKALNRQRSIGGLVGEIDL